MRRTQVFGGQLGRDYAKAVHDPPEDKTDCGELVQPAAPEKGYSVVKVG